MGWWGLDPEDVEEGLDVDMPLPAPAQPARGGAGRVPGGRGGAGRVPPKRPTKEKKRSSNPGDLKRKKAPGKKKSKKVVVAAPEEEEEPNLFASIGRMVSSGTQPRQSSDASTIGTAKYPASPNANESTRRANEMANAMAWLTNPGDSAAAEKEPEPDASVQTEDMPDLMALLMHRQDDAEDQKNKKAEVRKAEEKRADQMGSALDWLRSNDIAEDVSVGSGIGSLGSGYGSVGTFNKVGGTDDSQAPPSALDWLRSQGAKNEKVGDDGTEEIGSMSGRPLTAEQKAERAAKKAAKEQEIEEPESEPAMEEDTYDRIAALAPDDYDDEEPRTKAKTKAKKAETKKKVAKKGVTRAKREQEIQDPDSESAVEVEPNLYELAVALAFEEGDDDKPRSEPLSATLKGWSKNNDDGVDGAADDSEDLDSMKRVVRWWSDNQDYKSPHHKEFDKDVRKAMRLSRVLKKVGYNYESKKMSPDEKAMKLENAIKWLQESTTNYTEDAAGFDYNQDTFVKVNDLFSRWTPKGSLSLDLDSYDPRKDPKKAEMCATDLIGSLGLILSGTFDADHPNYSCAVINRLKDLFAHWKLKEDDGVKELEDALSWWKSNASKYDPLTASADENGIFQKSKKFLGMFGLKEGDAWDKHNQEMEEALSLWTKYKGESMDDLDSLTIGKIKRIKDALLEIKRDSLGMTDMKDMAKEMDAILSWYLEKGCKIEDLSKVDDMSEKANLRKARDLMSTWGMKADPSPDQLKEIAESLIYLRRNKYNPEIFDKFDGEEGVKFQRLQEAMIDWRMKGAESDTITSDEGEALVRGIENAMDWWVANGENFDFETADKEQIFMAHMIKSTWDMWIRLGPEDTFTYKKSRAAVDKIKEVLALYRDSGKNFDVTSLKIKSGDKAYLLKLKDAMLQWRRGNATNISEVESEQTVKEMINAMNWWKKKGKDYDVVADRMETVPVILRHKEVSNSLEEFLEDFGAPGQTPFKCLSRKEQKKVIDELDESISWWKRSGKKIDTTQAEEDFEMFGKAHRLGQLWEKAANMTEDELKQLDEETVSGSKKIDNVLTPNGASESIATGGVGGALGLLKDHEVEPAKKSKKSKSKKVKAVVTSDRTPKQRSKDLEKILQWMRKGKGKGQKKEDKYDPTGEYRKLDSMLPKKKGETPEDRALEIEGALDWLRSQEDAPAGEAVVGTGEPQKTPMDLALCRLPPKKEKIINWTVQSRDTIASWNGSYEVVNMSKAADRPEIFDSKTDMKKAIGWWSSNQHYRSQYQKNFAGDIKRATKAKRAFESYQTHEIMSTKRKTRVIGRAPKRLPGNSTFYIKEAREFEWNQGTFDEVNVLFSHWTVDTTLERDRYDLRDDPEDAMRRVTDLKGCLGLISSGVFHDDHPKYSCAVVNRLKDLFVHWRLKNVDGVKLLEDAMRWWETHAPTYNPFTSSSDEDAMFIRSKKLVSMFGMKHGDSWDEKTQEVEDALVLWRKNNNISLDDLDWPTKRTMKKVKSAILHLTRDGLDMNDMKSMSKEMDDTLTWYREKGSRIEDVSDVHSPDYLKYQIANDLLDVWGTMKEPSSGQVKAIDESLLSFHRNKYDRAKIDESDVEEDAEFRVLEEAMLDWRLRRAQTDTITSEEGDGLAHGMKNILDWWIANGGDFDRKAADMKQVFMAQIIKSLLDIWISRKRDETFSFEQTKHAAFEIKEALALYRRNGNSFDDDSVKINSPNRRLLPKLKETMLQWRRDTATDTFGADAQQTINEMMNAMEWWKGQGKEYNAVAERSEHVPLMLHRRRLSRSSDAFEKYDIFPEKIALDSLSKKKQKKLFKELDTSARTLDWLDSRDDTEGDASGNDSGSDDSSGAMLTEFDLVEEFDVAVGAGIDFRPEDSPDIMTLMMQRQQYSLGPETTIRSRKGK